MLRLPDHECQEGQEGDNRTVDQGQGQGQEQGVLVTAGDVAAVMVGFMGWLNDVSSGDNNSGSSSSSSSGSSSGGKGGAREGDMITAGSELASGAGAGSGSGLGPGLSLASTGKGVSISVREVLAWAAFVSQWVRVTAARDCTVSMDDSTTTHHPLASPSSSSTATTPSFATTVYAGVLHGAHMVVLDGLGIGLTAPRETIRALKLAVIRTHLFSMHPLLL